MPKKDPQERAPRKRRAEAATRLPSLNAKHLGVVLRGFVDAARKHSIDDAIDRPAHKGLDKQLHELGSQLFENMPAALAYFHVRSDEWTSWFAVAPFHITTKTAWLPPVIGNVVSCFGTRRGRMKNSGIDIECADGTAVIAPVDLEIVEVGVRGDAGRVIVANVVRDDGTFEGDGHRVTFAHLSSALVKRDQIVRAGEPIAFSGATGAVDAARLHFKVEWVDEGMFRENVTAIDPLAFVPELVLTGRVMPQPIVGGSFAALGSDNKPLSVIVAASSGRVTVRPRARTRFEFARDSEVVAEVRADGDGAAGEGERTQETAVPTDITEALQAIASQAPTTRSGEGLEGTF